MSIVIGSKTAARRVASVQNDRIVLAYPYDPVLNMAVKRHGGRFDPATKSWRLPLSGPNARFVVEKGFVTSDEESQEIIQAFTLVRSSDTTITPGEAVEPDAPPQPIEIDLKGPLTNLHPFQVDGVHFILAKRRALIGDVVGLGKTVQALAALEMAQMWPAIVVCPNGLKYNWRLEVEKWLPDRRVKICNGTKPELHYGEDIVIINYDILSARVDELVSLRPKALIFDEMHALKGRKTQRTRAALRLASVIPASGLVVGLSGTAVLNRPEELISPLTILGRFEQIGGNWLQYVTRYCAAKQRFYGSGKHWDISGASHIEELNEKLRAICYLRREKKEVLADLPPVQMATVPLELADDTLAEYRSIEDDVVDALMQRAARLASQAGDDPELAAARAARATLSAKELVQLNALRESLGRAKIQAVVSFLKDWIEGGGEKIVVFAWHREVQQSLVQALGCPAIFGGMPSREIEGAKRWFDTDPQCHTIVCSLRAGAEGHTLTAAQAVAFAELPWTPAMVDQAIGRVYGRLSNPHGVVAYRLLVPDTIDEWMQRLIEKKQAVVDTLLRGDTDIPADVDEASVMEGVAKLLLRSRGASTFDN